MRLLVLCGSLVLAGGLLRFERVGQVLRRWGHELVFATPGNGGENLWTSTLPIMSFEQARAARWDAVMVPGGGHPEALLTQLELFREPQFGLRVQHFLNASARKHAYLRVTAPFDPDLIIINNQHWTEADLAAFGARRISRLIGAVDTAFFAPPVARSWHTGRRRLGAIANKNPQALLAALAHLGEAWELHWFGRPDMQLLAANQTLVSQGRLVARGMLFGSELANYYHELDVFCSAELYAGWCNPAAEAMASGTPLVTTPNGTLAFAQDEQTALVIGEPTGEAIAASTVRLVEDSGLIARMACQGRLAIRDLTWDRYTADLLALIRAV